MPKGRHKVEGSRKCEQEVWRGKGRPKIWEKLFCVNKVSENVGTESQGDNMGAKTQEKWLEKTWKCKGKVKNGTFSYKDYKMMKFLNTQSNKLKVPKIFTWNSLVMYKCKPHMGRFVVVVVWLLFSYSLRSRGRQHTRLSSPSLSCGVCSDSCPLSRWCHPAISSSVALFSSWSVPASGSFPKSWLFIPGCQNIGASASGSVLPKNFQGGFP